jgi:hypothetical protein
MDLSKWESYLIGSAQEIYLETFEEYDAIRSANSRNNDYIFNQIKRDTERTFPHHIFFQQEAGTEMLRRVLLCLVLSREGLSIGYCQGMNFVAAVFLLALAAQMLNTETLQRTSLNTICLSELSVSSSSIVEYKTFRLMILVSKGKLRMSGLWAAPVSDMKLRSFQLDKLMKWIVPNLHSHFQRIQLSTDILVCQWFVTLFSYSLEVAQVIDLWDCIFHGEEWSIMFSVAIVLLKFYEASVLRIYSRLSSLVHSF